MFLSLIPRTRSSLSCWVSSLGCLRASACRRSSRSCSMRDSSSSSLPICSRAEVRYRSTFSGVIPGICSRTSVLALEVLRAAEAVGVEELDGRFREADGGERLRGELAHLLHARLAVDVQLPPGELGGEPDVLATAADRQRELVVGDDDLHRLVLVVEQHARDLGGLQRIADETGGILVPGHDVDLLAAQLLHYRLHAAALHAHAGADRIHVSVARCHRDLGAAA